MTLSLQSLARTIAKARHGTDAMWANYMGAAEAAKAECMKEAARIVIEAEPFAGPFVYDIARSLIAQPDSSDDVPVYLERP